MRCEHKGEIEVQCYSETWVMLTLMVRVPGVRCRVRIKCSEQCTERMILHLDLGSRFDMMVGVRLSFQFMVRCR